MVTGLLEASGNVMVANAISRTNAIGLRPNSQTEGTCGRMEIARLVLTLDYYDQTMWHYITDS
jgi:hypothetical protein